MIDQAFLSQSFMLKDGIVGRAYRTAIAVNLFALWCSGISTANAESVFVKYRGEVDLAAFACQDVSRSSLVYRGCFDQAHEYMLISLKGTYYHYCRIDRATVDGFLRAESMGRFYNARIKGHFDCRLGGVPN